MARKLLAAVFGLHMFAAGPANAASVASPEYAVKAAYLSKFGLFVEWPNSTFASPVSPIVICVLGTNPFGDVLERFAASQHIGSHPLAVRYLNAVAKDSGCKILFLGHSELQSVTNALAEVSGTAVLTVTDGTDQGDAKGIVDFVVQDNHVRFTIDQLAASRNDLTISFHLLDLALSVRRTK